MTITANVQTCMSSGYEMVVLTMHFFFMLSKFNEFSVFKSSWFFEGRVRIDELSNLYCSCEPQTVPVHLLQSVYICMRMHGSLCVCVKLNLLIQ